MAGGFIPMVFAYLKEHGVDTSDMDAGQAVEEYKKRTGGESGKGAGNKDNEKSREELEKKYDSDYSKGGSSALKDSIVEEKDIFETDSKTFRKNLLKAKESQPEDKRWRVAVHDESDYKNDKLFTTKAGSCVAIEPKGDIISVCRASGDKVRGTDLLRHAIKHGGDRLDAFGEDLYTFYTKNGFEPVSWTPFNEEFAPDDWKPEFGKEHIVFYKYTGKTTSLSYDDFIKNNKPIEDYDKAMSIRDEEIKK